MGPYPTPATIRFLTEHLNLPTYYEWMQDWPLEVADGARLREFCDLYEEGTPSEETQSALMDLLLYVLDDATPYDRGSLSVLEADELETQTNRVAQWLERDFERYAPIINYWRSGSDPNPEYGFAISPLMRRVWDECQTTTHHPPAKIKS